MKFGKVADPDAVDFAMRKDHAETSSLVLNHSADQEGKILVGCTGWSNKEWKGILYPPKSKPSDFLRYYSKSFDTVELNSTHYRTPPDEWISRWVSFVGEDFRFCPKASQMISHRTRLKNSDRFTEEFIIMLQKFGKNLGPAFLQLPETFDERRISDLLDFLIRWPKEFDLSIELRNPVWFEDSSFSNEVFDLMRTKEISPVITDTSGRRDVLHQRLTTKKVLIRFVGNDLHPTDYQRIDDWTKVLKRWIFGGVREIYFFVHQHDNEGIVELSTYLIDKLNVWMENKVKTPVLLGAQGSLF
jgi:uncharacterized protein YecE (DUF72 family)